MRAGTQERATLLARVETLLEISGQLSRIQPLDTLLGNMAVACGRLLDSDSVGIRVVEGDELVLTGIWGDARAAMPTARIKVGESLSGLVVATGRPLLISDPANDPRLLPAHREPYRRGGYRAFLGVPLKLGEQVLGVLSARTRREDGFSEDDLSIATAFAGQAAIALENARLYRQTEARAEKLKTLAALTRLMTSAESSPALCQAIASASTILLGAAVSAVFVADPVARVLRVEGIYAPDPRVKQAATALTVIPYGQGLAGHILESRTPEYIQDLGSDSRSLNRHLSTEMGLRGFAGLPLIAGDEVVGVLSIFFRAGRPFTSEERELMALLADQAATAIRNVRLLQALTTRQAHLETLLGGSSELSKFQPVESLLETIAEACGRLLDSGSVGFRLVEGEDLVLAGCWGDAKEVMTKLRLKIGESISGRVVVSGEPLLITDLANDPRVIPEHRETIRRQGYRAALTVPVKVGDRTVGVLSIRTRRSEGYSAEDLRTATAFASQAAVALENSRLFQETQRAYAELSETQAQLLQAGKLAAVGRLAAGVAHEVNNPLTVIVGQAQLLRLKSTDPEVLDKTERICASAMRAARIISELQTFARPQAGQLSAVSLADVIQSVLGLHEQTLRNNGIGVDKEIAPGLPWVWGNAQQLGQVVLNLLLNAEQAVAQSGERPCITVRLTTREGGVRLVVSDTGPGIAPENLPRIFEPFFTTKPVGQGTGLGLSICYSIVAAHGGKIWAESEPGKGAALVVELPASKQPAIDGATPATPAVSTPRRGHILVVDDEEDVADTLRDLLESLGQRVTVAIGGASGWERLATPGAQYDMVTLDLKMPDLPGAKLWERLMAVGSPLAERVVFVTGDTVSSETHQFLEHTGRPVLQKPFDLEDLVALVRRQMPA